MIRNIRYLIFSICFVICFINTSFAQTTNKFDFERIEDNSFLIEEAYNQDPGVIQHISSFQYMKDHTWLYTFTDEWPVPGRKHQLSTTNSLFINPGMRYAINFKSGLQIVPGIAVPIGIGSSNGASGIYAYLSFEHPLWKP